MPLSQSQRRDGFTEGRSGVSGLWMVILYHLYMTVGEWSAGREKWMVAKLHRRSFCSFTKQCVGELDKKGSFINYLYTSISSGPCLMTFQYQQSKPKSEEQTGKLIDSFQLELQWLKKYIFSYSSINVKIHEFILTRYLSLLPIKEGYIVALCLLYISFEALCRAKAGPSMVQKSKWNQQLEEVAGKVQQMRHSHKELEEQYADFYLKLKMQGKISELREQYEKFLNDETFGIYKHEPNIWRMLIFQSYCARQMKEEVMDESSAVSFLQKFRLYLRKQQQDLCQRRQTGKLIADVVNTNEDYLNEQLYEMMRSETYLPLSHFQKKTGKSSWSGPYPTFKAGFTIKDMLLLQINLETISLVERCQTYQCPFMIFHIPFTYLLASTLTYYTNFKELYLYHIFATLCKKINTIKNGANPQLPIPEINDCLVDFMQFHKVSGRQQTQRLGLFLKKYQRKMATFIPVYYQIFCFHAFEKYDFVEKLFAEKGTIGERRKKMKDRIEAIYESYQKYNSDNL